MDKNIKMKNYLKNISSLSIKNLSIVLIFGFAFLAFYHGDFIQTTYISTFWNNNLYEKCGSCNYFPLIYWLFYLWDFPLRFFFDIATPVGNDHFFFLYNKFLIVFLFFGSIYFTYKIAQKLGIEKSKDVALMYALSPFAFFVIFFFSGYDIFSVFFSLIGTYLFLQKSFFWSFLIFSISLSFKFFSLVIALSFLAFLSYSYLKKILLAIVLFIIPFLQFIVFFNDPNFIEGVFYLVKRHSSNENIFFNPALLVGILFLVWLFALHFIAKVKNYFQGQNIIYIPYVAILFLFCWSPVSPPWIILILPFLYLVSSKNKIQKLFLTLESFFFILFSIVVSNIWSRNIDLSIGNNGIFKFLYNPTNLYKDFYIDLNNNQLLFLLSFGFFYIFFFLPILLIKFKKSFFLNDCKVQSIIYSRFLFSVVFFIFPFLLSPLVPEKNQFLNSLNSSRIVTHSYVHSQDFIISPHGSICDLIDLTYDNLQFIGLRTNFNEKIFLKDINFSYTLEYNHIPIEEYLYDKKIIYLKLPKLISFENKQTQFCIHNKSNQTLNLMVQNTHEQLNQINGYSTFIKKNIPLNLYYKNLN